MKVLLVYPEFTETFWGLKYAVKLTNRKCTFPPFGLLTIASLLPESWDRKLVDMNVEKLKDEDIKWADYVFLSAMDFQIKSASAIIARCNKIGTKVVAGGPLFTTNPARFKNVAHIIIGEAEIALPQFIEDVKKGNAKHIYHTKEWVDMEKSPVPQWDLIDMNQYLAMCVQYSRGCPFDCDFCCITRLFGNKFRTKGKEQIINELDKIYKCGWRGTVFFVDDNFIGNRAKLKSEILPAIKKWSLEKNSPFTFYTQASINLADDEELIQMMVDIGFNAVFIGIESTDNDCLKESSKTINRNRDLVANVKKIQRAGMEVYGSFIVGFDSDKQSVFDSTIKFIKDCDMPIAMVNLLSAPKGTRLYSQVMKEGRLLSEIIYDGSITNMVPKMGLEQLLKGYRKILSAIYSPGNYYRRVMRFLENFRPRVIDKMDLSPDFSMKLKVIWRHIFILGFLDRGRFYFWRAVLKFATKDRELLKRAIVYLSYGYHFRKTFNI